MIVDPSDPTLSEAMSALADSSGADAPETQASANTDPTAPGKETTEVQDTPKTDAESDSTPAETEPKTPDISKPDEKPDQSKATEKEPSKYEKAAQRQSKSWEQLNKEKEDVRALRQQVEAEKAKIAEDRAAIEAERAKVSAPKYKPDDYDNAADKKELESHRLEGEGKYEEAERAKWKAQELREHAKYLRENPPPTNEQLQAKSEATKREWYSKAAIDYPATARQGTPEAEALKGMIAQIPAILEQPEQMYYACRLVTAETAAARVPKLEGELGQLRAKIKELEETTTVPADGATSAASRGNVPFEQLSTEAQLQSLETQAKGLGYIN